jgi:peptidyl-prolyl cis-trans isomerase SurA
MVRDKLPSDPTISPTKIENYYVQNRDKYKLEDQVKLRMIVLNVPQGASPDDLKPLADEIVKKLRSGIPFEEMAKIYSQGSQARDGGDWGWVQRTVLREELVEVAFNLKPGTRSEPVATPQAIYIMQVDDSKVSYIQTLSEVRGEIENTLKAAEMDRRRTQWIEQLEKKYFVAYF